MATACGAAQTHARSVPLVEPEVEIRSASSAKAGESVTFEAAAFTHAGEYAVQVTSEGLGATTNRKTFSVSVSGEPPSIDSLSEGIDDAAERARRTARGARARTAAEIRDRTVDERRDNRLRRRGTRRGGRRARGRAGGTGGTPRQGADQALKCRTQARGDAARRARTTVQGAEQFALARFGRETRECRDRR